MFRITFTFPFGSVVKNDPDLDMEIGDDSITIIKELKNQRPDNVIVHPTFVELVYHKLQRSENIQLPFKIIPRTASLKINNGLLIIKVQRGEPDNTLAAFPVV